MQITNFLQHLVKNKQTCHLIRLWQQMRFHQRVTTLLISLPKSPPPNSYNLPTEFTSPEKVKKGFCFGKGRAEMTITGPLAETINNKNPGPGAY